MSAGLLLCSALAQAGNQQDIDDILAQPEAPMGVVFEVLAGADGLEWAIPKIVEYSAQLRARFADIGIAVVSHGREQFALQTSKSQAYAEIHRKVKSLVKDQHIPVHVCGTHAAWRGLGEEDFPDYVDVAPAGPAQINDYVAIGYRLIRLGRD